MTLLKAIIEIWLELAPWMLLGAAAAGLLHVLIPVGWLQKHLSGRMGVLKAVAIGVPLPLCSCGVIPVGLGLRKDGASPGAVVGFLISTPQTGIDSILVSATFLGWPFAILKVVAALITGLAGGTLTDVLAPDHGSSGSDSVPADSCFVGHDHAPPASGWTSFAQHSLMLIQSIRGWLVVGVLVSALISVVVPEQKLADVTALRGPMSLLVSLLISLPLYICATASVPIAAALVSSGFPPGAALVFLMAGPATNVATLGAVYRALGRRPLLIYLATIIGGSLLAGLLFNQLIPGASAAHHHDHSSQWWHVLSGLLLAILLGKSFADDLRHWLKKVRQPKTAVTQSVTLKVAGMTCRNCSSRLERVLEARPGVHSATVSLDSSEAVITGSASRQDLIEAVTAAGFSVSD
ncbi:MAG: permease [Planctomycetaceae bacterium]